MLLVARLAVIRYYTMLVLLGTMIYSISFYCAFCNNMVHLRSLCLNKITSVRRHLYIGVY